MEKQASRRFTENVGSCTDAQGDWWSQPLTTSTTGNLMETMASQVQVKATKKKMKKSRRNRKLQRYRAKLIKQGHHSESIAKLTDNPTHAPIKQKDSNFIENRQMTSMQPGGQVRFFHSVDQCFSSNLI